MQEQINKKVYDVADIHVFPAKADQLQHHIQKLPCRPDKRNALQIFLFSRAFSHKSCITLRGLGRPVVGQLHDEGDGLPPESGILADEGGEDRPLRQGMLVLPGDVKARAGIARLISG